MSMQLKKSCKGMHFFSCLIRHPVRIHDAEFAVDPAPVFDRHRPFFGAEIRGQIKSLQQCRRRWKNTSLTVTLKKMKFDENLAEIIKRIYEYQDSGNLIDQYIELKRYRDEFLLLLESSNYVECGYKEIISSLENLAVNLRVDYSKDNSLKKTLIHELFIYIVAYYCKLKDREALRYILNKTYFIGISNFNEEDDSYNSFYDHNAYLDQAVCRKDEKKYHSGTANLWMDLNNIDICTKSEFVFGDLLCYNCSY